MEPERAPRSEKPPLHNGPGVDARHPALQQVKHVKHLHTHTHNSHAHIIFQQVVSLLHLSFLSADDDFDSTFKTNVLVNSSGYAEYLPPGEPHPFLPSLSYPNLPAVQRQHLILHSLHVSPVCTLDINILLRLKQPPWLLAGYAFPALRVTPINRRHWLPV